MTPEQKQRAMQMLRRFSQTTPMTRTADNAAVAMAALLQELVDADDKFKTSVLAAINAAAPNARHVEVDGQPVFFSRSGDDITDTHTLTPCPHCGGSGAAEDCAPEPEPFGYFKSEPFGWTDCAETDDGAIALFAAPPAPSVQDAELVTVPRELLGAASYAIKKNLPAPKILEQLRRYALGGVAAPTPAPSVPDEVPDAVIDAVADAIGGAYDCLRVWSAWEYGTMGPDDFLPVTDDADRVAEIARAALSSWLATAPTPADVLIATNPAQISSLAAPAPEPVARVTGYYAGHLSIATVDGRVLPAGTALYLAPPAPSVPVEPMENIALNEWLDKTEWVQKELNTFPVSSLGMHRADVMRLEIERLREMLAAAPTPAEAPADVARDNVASEPVGYLYTNLQSGEYHVSDADDDYRGPERVLWCIEPVYRRAKGQR